MKLNLDITSDFSGRTLYHALEGAYIPEFFKTASFDDLRDASGLTANQFADPVRRAFPINSKEACFASHVYLTTKQAGIEKALSKNYFQATASRVKAAADLFGISEELDRFTHGRVVKQASARDIRHIGTFEIGESLVTVFPVKTAEDLLAAADTFTREKERLPMDWRFKIAKEMVEAAPDFGVDELPDTVCKYAGLFYPDKTKIATELNRRAAKVSRPENIERYEALKTAAAGAETVEDFQKIAEICYQIEKSEDLHRNFKTASVLQDPVDIIFSIPVEKVASMLNTVKVGHKMYDMKDLRETPSGVYKEAFGIDIDPKDSSALTDVLPTMPMSDMALFEELSGVKPL